jgi:hypothetical protein
MLFALVCLTLLTPSVIADTFVMPPSEATPPDASVTHWIWYQFLGPRNHLSPIIYISTRRFDTHLPEVLIVMTRPRFDIVASYTRSRIARPDCSTALPYPYQRYTFDLVEHDRGATQRCVIPRASACEYFTGLRKLPKMNWARAELDPINRFISELGCGVDTE